MRRSIILGLTFATFGFFSGEALMTHGVSMAINSPISNEAGKTMVSQKCIAPSAELSLADIFDGALVFPLQESEKAREPIASAFTLRPMSESHQDQ